MLKFKWYLLLLITLLINSWTLCAEVVQYENQVIEKINISYGSTQIRATIEPESIKPRLSIREGEAFSQTKFDNDLKTLAKEFYRVEPIIESINNKLTISLKIWLRPIIRTINWCGNEKIKSSKLEKELGIKVNNVFDREEFNKAFHKLKLYYIKQGFFEAQLNYNVVYDNSCNEVDISISIEEGRAGKIKEISFVDFTSCEEEEVLETMCTKKYNFFTSWLTGEGTYLEEAVQQDKFIILNYLQNQGYADAKVEIEIREACEANRIIVEIKADKGQRYYLGCISFSGNTIFTDEQLLSVFKIQEKCPYSPEKIHDSLRTLMNLYGRYGYIESFIDYESRLQEDKPVYNIHVTIDEGEQYFVGIIKVIGNTSTQTNVILNETLLVPGEVFNMSKMQITEARLRNIGYFKNVNVYAGNSDADGILPGNYRDVNIEVEETSTGNFGAFFGISTIESVFGGLNVTERNFNIQGFSRVWKEGYRALRGGGEYAHITTTIGARSNSYVFSWTKPYFMDSLWSVGFDLNYGKNNYIANNYNITSTGFNVHGNYLINQFVKLGVHFRVTYSDIDIRHSHKKRKPEDDEGKTPAQIAQEIEDDKNETDRLKDNHGIVAAVGPSLTYDSTNHPLKPTCGFKSRGDLEFAGFGGNSTFISMAYLNTYFLNAWDKGVFKFRADARFILPVNGCDFDNLLLDERLFLGGDSTIRGYRSYRLGPQTDNHDPKGGLSLQLLSVEYIRTIVPRVDVFAFFDSGHLSGSKFSFGRMRNSVGFGINLQVFESGPPLVMGMGFPINPKNKSEVKRFFLTIGGRF